MLLAEKNNNLLMKNDQARPTSTRALPEVNAISCRNPHRERGNRGREKGARPDRSRHGRRGSQRNGPYDRGQRGQGPRGQGPHFHGPRGWNHSPSVPKARNERNTGPARRPQIQDDLCYQCGGIDHWSRTCRALAQAIEEYHASRVT